MGIESNHMIQKEKSKDNYNCKVTSRWEAAQGVILFKTKNGGKPTVDEIPGGIKQKLAKLEQQIQSDKLQSTNTIMPSSSEGFISSQSSVEEKHDDTQQIKPYKPQSPIARPTFSRNNSNASASSFSYSAKSRITKPLSRSNTNTSLFSTNSKSERPKILKFDREGSLVILSKNHPFLEKINDDRKKIPLSYGNAIRIDNLTDAEIDDIVMNYVNKVIAVGKPNCKA
ncbi:MAG: hypothetical protein WA659_05040 [Candidatus Aquirickettsiella sp.]